jgi:hypothetical protein
MKQIFLTLALSFSLMAAMADSPLTSTSFYTAYEGVPAVTAAVSANGELNATLMDFLSSKNPIAHKMAVINAIGWAFEGHNNYERYKSYLGDKTGKGKLKAENMLCLAYLKALDNYFECTEALKMSDEALALNTKSYTFNIIRALIKAQVLFDTDWCGVYQVADNVRKNTNLTLDMNNGATFIIFDYMDLYKTECGK